MSSDGFVIFPFNGPCAHILKSSILSTCLGNLIVPLTVSAGIEKLYPTNCQYNSEQSLYFFIISFSLLYNGCELWLLLTLFSVYNTDF